MSSLHVEDVEPGTSAVRDRGATGSERDRLNVAL